MGGGGAHQGTPPQYKITSLLNQTLILRTQNDKKNDYCQHFVNTGERPQNFIRDIKPNEWFVGIVQKDNIETIQEL